MMASTESNDCPVNAADVPNSAFCRSATQMKILPSDILCFANSRAPDEHVGNVLLAEAHRLVGDAEAAGDDQLRLDARAKVDVAHDLYTRVAQFVAQVLVRTWRARRPTTTAMKTLDPVVAHGVGEVLKNQSLINPE